MKRPPLTAITSLVFSAHPRSSRAGLTLLELFVALGIFSVVALGLVSAILGADRLRTFSRERAAAGLAAASRVEEVLASDWEALPARSGETFPVAIEGQAGSWALTPLAGDPEPGLVTISDGASPDLRRVRVTVRWRSRAGGEGRVELSTLVARH